MPYCGASTRRRVAGERPGEDGASSVPRPVTAMCTAPLTTAVRAEPRLQRRERRELGVERERERRVRAHAPGVRRRERAERQRAASRVPARAESKSQPCVERVVCERAARPRASSMPNAKLRRRRRACRTPKTSPRSRRIANVPVSRGVAAIDQFAGQRERGRERQRPAGEPRERVERHAVERAARRRCGRRRGELAEVGVAVGDRDRGVADAHARARRARASPAPQRERQRRRGWRATSMRPVQRSVAGAATSRAAREPAVEDGDRVERHRRSPRGSPCDARACLRRLRFAVASVTSPVRSFVASSASVRRRASTRHDGARGAAAAPPSPARRASCARTPSPKRHGGGMRVDVAADAAGLDPQRAAGVQRAGERLRAPRGQQRRRRRRGAARRA